MMANALAMMMPPTGLPGVDPTRQPPMPGMSTSTAVAPAPMQAPRQNALATPMTANFNPPKPKQQNMLLSSAVNGFQRGLDPKGWQAGQDQAKADKAEGVKKQIAMLQNIRALPMEQRMQALPQISQSIGKQIPPELMQDQAIDTHLAMLMGEAGMAPSTPEPMSEYQRAQIALEEQKMQQPKPSDYDYREIDGPEGPGTYAVNKADPSQMQFVGKAVPKLDPANYDTVTMADGVWAVNKRDPKDRIRLGSAPPKGTGSGANARNPNGLTPYQEIQFQYKLDDLDRELADKERSRRTNLSTVDGSIALLDSFTGDLSKTPEGAENFREVYGNWVNPTGEGNDLLNPRVQPGSKRANGMAMLEQLGGRAFLDSIAAMRGTGPLSDREGARVTAAATRLTAVTQSDEAALEAAKEFRAALVAYKSALEQDIETNRRAEASRRAQMQAMLGRNPAGQQAPDGEDDDMDGLIDGLFGDQGQEDDDVSDLLDKYK